MDAWKILLEKDVQQFIVEHEQADGTTIALLPKTVKNVPPNWLAAQIIGRQKVKAKIPTYYQGEAILYPPSLNIEQSSSQATALFKAGMLADILPYKKSVADLTGGFGVDSFFLSQRCQSLIHVEPNAELQQLAAHNHRQLGAQNIQYVNQKAEDFLKTLQERVDLFYIDPSRRKEGQKVFSLNDCEPNIETLQETIFAKANILILKAAPLLDLHSGIKSLHFTKKVFVVSVNNECKELLFLCEKDFSEEPEINAINLTNEGEQISSYAFTFSQEREAAASFNEPQSYLYEPNASILKAGAFKSMAQSFGLDKLAPSTHLYTSKTLIENFPGRIFKLVTLVKADSKSVFTLLPDGKANVLTRNYPMKPEELKKKLKLQDGGDAYLIGFSGTQSKYLALCSRVK